MNKLVLFFASVCVLAIAYLSACTGTAQDQITSGYVIQPISAFHPPDQELFFVTDKIAQSEFNGDNFDKLVSNGSYYILDAIKELEDLRKISDKRKNDKSYYFVYYVSIFIEEVNHDHDCTIVKCRAFVEKYEISNKEFIGELNREW